MYNLDQLATKTIWLFREPRTGGTWLTTALQKELKRGTAWPGETDKVIDPTTVIINFHNFKQGFEHIQEYDDPILIRTTRRNKADILISDHVRTRIGDYMISTGVPPINNITTEEEYIYIKNIMHNRIKPFVITQREIDNFIACQKTKFDVQWNINSRECENETVYYEDLLESWSSSILPITLSMKNQKQFGEGSSARLFTHKIPYDKKELILNYEEIVEKMEHINVF